jgi:hypothetical protein
MVVKGILADMAVRTVKFALPHCLWDDRKTLFNNHSQTGNIDRLIETKLPPHPRKRTLKGWGAGTSSSSGSQTALLGCVDDLGRAVSAF